MSKMYAQQNLITAELDVAFGGGGGGGGRRRSRRGNNVNLQNRRANMSDAERQATNCTKEAFGATIAGGIAGPKSAAAAGASYVLTGRGSCSIVTKTLFN